MDEPDRLEDITPEQLLEDIPAAVALYSLDGNVLGASRSALSIAGKPWPAGHHVTQTSPAWGPTVARRIAEIQDGGELPEPDLMPFAMGDGISDLWRLTYFALRNAAGGVAAVGVSYEDVSANERTARRLRSFEQVVAQTSNAVGMMTLDNHLIYLNPAGRRLLGHTEAEPLLGQVGAYVDGGEPAEWVKTGDWGGSVVLNRADGGGSVAVEGVVFTVQSEDGAPLFRALVVRDVRDRDRALRRLELQFERMPVPVVTVAHDATVQRWNPAAAELFGHSVDAAVGLPLDRLLLAPRLRELSDPIHTTEQLLAVMTADGRQLEIGWSAVPLDDVAEGDEATMLIGRDLTVQLRAERDRREALEVARMATWTLSLETLRIESSEGLHELLGLVPGTPLGLRDCLRLVDSGERHRLADMRRSLNERSWFRQRVKRRLDGGDESWFAISGRRSGNRVHGNLRDVTIEQKAALRVRELDEQRRRLLERMLLTEEEERGRIAGALHDDTVQLMAALQLNLDRIGVALGGEAPAATTLLAETRSALTDALDRTRHLMFELRPQQFDRHGLRYAISALCDQVALETGMIMSVDVSSQRFAPLIEELCYRTVREAVVNARKHSGASHLAVRVHEDAGAVHGSVTDDGQGFDFERLSRRRLQLHMGLDAMTERLRMADGQCEVRTAPRQGCSVIFSIPLGERREVPR